MEAAAKTIQSLTKRILPEKPHSLAISDTWKYRMPADESKLRKHFEEWDNTRLQYMTLLSEADRGVLWTRPYYEMRQEPTKPLPKDINSLAKPAGEKKKLSLSDYKYKKTGATAESTPEPQILRKHAGSRPIPEIRKPDANRPRETNSDRKPSKPPINPVVDMRHAPSDSAHWNAVTDLNSLPPKPPTKASLPPRPVSPDRRKRGADPDDELRPVKRPRPDVGRVQEDRSRPIREEPPRRKDHESHTVQEREAPKESKSTSSLLPNGRGVLKGANRNPSPAGRARGDSVNGVRPSLNQSSKNTPNKSDTPSSKTFVPPLLSPLHLNLGGHDAAENRERKRAREDAVDGTKPTKPKKPEAPIRKERSPVRLPPLLSPTLPPLVEAELSRRKKTSPPKPSESKSKDDGGNEDRQREEKPSPVARKAPVEQGEEDEGKTRKGFIVTVKIPKRIRQTVKRILALPSRKEPQRQERSASIEAPASQAKKRPANAEVVGDSISVKRPRPSDIPSSSRLPPPPSTPSKKGTTAMSRVNSSNSQVHTPGENNTATPSAAPGSSDRGANGTADPAEIRAANEKHNRFSTLARRLKHNGDAVMKRNAQTANGNARPSESNVKLGYVLSIESMIAFMTSFHWLNVGRSLSGKACDPASWESLFPMLDFVKGELRRVDQRRYQPLVALVHILNAVSLEETVKCYGTLMNLGDRVGDFIKLERLRTRSWFHIREIIEGLDSKVYPNISPWSNVDEVSLETIRVLRRWCADERVEWTPEMPTDNKGAKSH